jgi:hypothetical protein
MNILAGILAYNVSFYHEQSIKQIPYNPFS